MALSILGGVAKGLKISVPKGDDVRPTSVMLRRKPFDSYQSISTYTFIDLCAGSGAVGLEALSRGASSLVFVESSKKNLAVINENIGRYTSKYGVDQPVNIQITCGDAASWVDNFKKQYEIAENRSEYIIFFDPPYHNHKLYEKIVNMLVAKKWFKGYLWVESDNRKGPAQDFWDMLPVKPEKVFVQGDNSVFCYNMG